ncbi:MAG: hypothetical protein LBQ35_06725 [Spirochaetaceae bacterium]|jgi:hypothetical protein|nr:hypothetical protein [Spirochaetaceae bacterium]
MVKADQYEGGPLRFVALVPHRDIRPALRDWQARLFASGLGRGVALQVWAFPPAAPLASAGPLSAGELSALARALRRGAPGGFSAGPPLASHEGPGGLVFWGLPLEPAPDPAALPTGSLFHPPLLCAFITGGDPAEREAAREIAALTPAPAIRFRAAATANLVLEPLKPGKDGAKPFEGVSLVWKTGKLHWLPRN